METVGRYSLIQKLATGGMAEVFLARAEGPMGFQKKLVVKRILPHLADDPQFIEMFLQEAKLAAQLEHSNIVQVFDFGQAGRDYFLAMEFVDGANLRSLNAKARALLGPLEPALCARLVALACEGLNYAHNAKSQDDGQPLNLVHRDISPDNILVSRTGAVKVADFGIARVEAPVHRTRSGVLKGKLAYMPPEQLGRLSLDRRVDVYALGVVLYELLCGGMPFDATSEVSIIQAVMSATPLTPVLERRSDVPHGLARIVTRALAKNRDERYPDCKAMQADLERFIQDSGRVVGASEISAFFAELDAVEEASREPSDPLSAAPLDPAVALGATHPSQPSISNRNLDAIGPTEVTKRSDPEREQRPMRASQGAKVDPSEAETVPPDANVSPARPPHRTRTDEMSLSSLKPKGPRATAPLLIGLVVLGAAATFGVMTVFFSGDVTSAAVDAGTASVVVAPPAALDAGAAAPREAVDAGAAVAQAPVDAGSRPPPVEPPDRTPKAPAKATVQFRVRPWANVSVDGKPAGTTPLSLLLTVGRHKIVLENPKLKKKVEKDVVVKPGTIVEHNFNE